MCGRYFFELRELPAFARLKQKIEQQALFEYAREEVFPSNSALVLVDGQEDYELDVMKWGIEGPYGRLINARSEGIEKKKTFRPMLSKKCLIPLHGIRHFFESMGRNVFFFSIPSLLALISLPYGPSIPHFITSSS